MIKFTLFMTLLLTSAICSNGNNWKYTQVAASQVASDKNLNAAFVWGSDMILAKLLKNSKLNADAFSADISYAGKYSMNNANYYKFIATFSNNNGAVVEATFVVRCNSNGSYQLWSWKANMHYSYEKSSDNEESSSDNEQSTGNNGGVEVSINKSDEECSTDNEASTGNNGGVEVSINKSDEECSTDNEMSMGNNGGVEVSINKSDEECSTDNEASTGNNGGVEVSINKSDEECSTDNEMSMGNNGGVEVSVEATAEECSEEGSKHK